MSSSDIALRRNAFGFSTPLRRFLAATRASVSCEIPWSCMYLLIFIPKNFVVMNWPTSPYHDGHAYRRGSARERAGNVLVHADRDAEVAVAEPDRVGGHRQRARRGRAPVVDVGERDPGETQQRDDRVGVVDLVAPAERELDVAPLARPRRPARAGSRSRPSRYPTRRRTARTDAGRRRRSRRPSCVCSRGDRTEGEGHDFVALVVGAERERARAPSPCRLRALRDRPSVSRVSTFTSSGSSTKPTPNGTKSRPVGPVYGGDGGGKSCVVQAHSRPRRGSRCSAIDGRRAARARVLRGERDDPAVRAPAPDQLRARPRAR